MGITTEEADIRFILTLRQERKTDKEADRPPGGACLPSFVSFRTCLSGPVSVRVS